MPRISTSHWIDAPPEVVFDYVTDFSNCDRWMQNLVRIEIEGGGPLAEGSVFHETRKEMGREATETFPVTGLERPNRMAVHCDSEMCRASFDFTTSFTPENGGTRLDCVGDVESRGWMGRLFSGMGKGMMRRAIARDHEALKAAIETDHAAT